MLCCSVLGWIMDWCFVLLMTTGLCYCVGLHCVVFCSKVGCQPNDTGEKEISTPQHTQHRIQMNSPHCIPTPVHSVLPAAAGDGCPGEAVPGGALLQGERPGPGCQGAPWPLLLLLLTPPALLGSSPSSWSLLLLVPPNPSLGPSSSFLPPALCL